jgi:hypothetical protein
MTAALVYLAPTSVSLLTDGAMITPDGSTVALKQKVQIAAHQSAAFVARGPDMFSALVAVAMAQVQGGFEDLVASFAGRVVSAHQHMMTAMRGGAAVPGDPSKVDAILVGVGSDGRAAAYVVSSYPDEGHPAWALRPIKRPAAPSGAVMRFAPELVQPALTFASPMPEAVEADLKTGGLNLWGGSPDVKAHGLAVMRAQRRTGTVGGFCQMTTITKDGVSSSIVERWSRGGASQPA